MKSRQRFSGEPGVHNGSAYHRLVGSLTAPIFIAGALLAFAGLLAAPAQAQTSVSHNWELNPAGFESGDSFRLLFLSADTRNATSSDIGEYNTFVQNLAANGHSAIQAYAAGFRVVGCTSARSTPATTPPPRAPRAFPSTGSTVQRSPTTTPTSTTGVGTTKVTRPTATRTASTAPTPPFLSAGRTRGAQTTEQKSSSWVIPVL